MNDPLDLASGDIRTRQKRQQITTRLWFTLPSLGRCQQAALVTPR